MVFPGEKARRHVQRSLKICILDHDEDVVGSSYIS